VTALEPDPSYRIGAGAARNLAKDAGLSIDVVETWGEELPFADESFDLVYTRAVLHHARDLRQLCGEIGRTLRTGGVYIATREHVLTNRVDLDTFLASHPLHKVTGNENAYLLEEYVNAMVSAGIKITRTLNPKQSDINLFPATRGDVKKRWAGKMGWPFPKVIPDYALTVYGALERTPGRLYSFIGRK
jgi:SAM-dependent methyltransferase